MTKFIIYGLTDPRNNEVRYIGYTSKTIEIRLKAHIYDANKNITSHKANWIRSLNKYGLRPNVFLIEECDSMQDAMKKERYYISKYTNLTNSTNGGELCKVYTDYVLEKMSINRRGKAVGVMNPMFGKKRPDLSARNKNVNPESSKKTGEALRALYNSDGYKDILRCFQACKPIVRLDFEGNILAKYGSLRHAGLDGFGRKEIMKVINGIHKQHKGYNWKYDKA